MPSRLLLALAAGIALTWFVACNRGTPPVPAAAPNPQPAPAAAAPSVAVDAAPAGAAVAAPQPENPSAAEVAAIEHPHVPK